MAGWVTSPMHGVSNTFVASRRIVPLLLARVIAWEDLLDQRRAWDALIWFAPLLMMADVLNENGAIKVPERRTLRGHQRMAVAGLVLIALVAGLLLRALRIRQHDGAGDGAVSWIFRGGAGGRSAAIARGAAVGVFLQLERGDDALRYRVGAGLLRGGLCAAGGVVAAGGPHFRNKSFDLDGNRAAVVESGGYLVILVRNWWDISGPRRGAARRGRALPRRAGGGARLTLLRWRQRGTCRRLEILGGALHQSGRIGLQERGSGSGAVGDGGVAVRLGRQVARGADHG